MAQDILTKDKPLDGKDLLERGQKWLERIESAEKREKDWMDDAEGAETAYAARHNATRGKVPDFNIIHSNVETIVPAIYNSTAVADIRSRNTLADPEAPPQPQPGPNGEPPNQQAVQQFRIAQMQYQAQVARVKSVKDFATMLERAITVQIDDNKLDTEVESCAQDSFLGGRGIVRVRIFADDNGERLGFEAVSWRDFRHGPAKRWADVGWMAFRHSMASEEAERISDKEVIGAQLAIDPDRRDGDSSDDDIVVWEIWCKGPDGNYVEFVRASDGKILNRKPDPLGLSTFFPIATPVQPITLTGSLIPTSPVVIYKKLADELDTATRRINAITKGLKTKGAVAGNVADIEKWAQGDDNSLTVISDLEALAQTGGIEKAIAWWPIEQAANVLKQLYAQRESIKQAIYEITGISDIVRGASNAGETATAQQIKTQWGSLRIQKMQRQIERLVRDLFVISAEIIVTKFQPQTLQLMTGIEITPEIQEMMSQRTLANYRIDIESGSTVRADVARQREEHAQFLEGTGAFFTAFAPMVQTDPRAAEPITELFAAMTSSMNLGKQATDALEKLTSLAKQAAENPPPNPAEAQLKVEQEKQQAESQRAEQEHSQKMALGDQQMKQKAEEHTFRMNELREQRQVEGLRLASQVKREDHQNKQADEDREFKRTSEAEKHQRELAIAKAPQGSIEEVTEMNDQQFQMLAESQKMLAEAIAQGNAQIGQGLSELAAAIKAPKQVVRDPKTGRATGVASISEAMQ